MTGMAPMAGMTRVTEDDWDGCAREPKNEKKNVRFCKRLQCSDGRDGSIYMEMENLAKAQLENFR